MIFILYYTFRSAGKNGLTIGKNYKEKKYYSLKEKMESFGPKKLSHCELKFDPGF